MKEIRNVLAELKGSEPDRVIIVSGHSGGGKSTALNALEDLGYYCIDNLPASLLESAVEDVIGKHEA